MAAIESSADPMDLLQELRVLAPDLWESGNRCLILPQTLGDFGKPEYAEDIQNMLHSLNEYIGMFNAGLISQSEYERKKIELLLSMQSSQRF